MRSRVQSILDLAADFTTIGELVVIGGYAVSARSKPRFSQDLDLVIHNDSLPEIESVLRGRGFTPGKEFANPDKNIEFGDTTREWTLAEPPATVDIMAGGLMDRSVRLWIPYNKISRGATIEGIPNAMGLTPEPRLSVASAEVLVGLKVQPLRGQDVVDLVSLAGTADGQGCRRSLVDMVGEEKAKSLLANLLSALESSALVSHYSAAFGIKRPQAAKQIDGARGFYRAILTPLSQR